MGRGYYPRYAKEIWHRRGVKEIVFAEGDEEILREGQLDFISFSYYRPIMSIKYQFSRRSCKR